MGSFSGLLPGHATQLFFSAVKVPLLLLATFALSLPCFYVVNSLMGLRADFGEAVRALLSAQAGVTVVLASLSPITLLWYASSGVYGEAILFNGAMFAVATGGGQVVLWREYRRLIARDRRHAVMLVAWLFVYSFVGMQMGWSLRPFIGDPVRPPQFFREDFGGNAYVVVGVKRLIRTNCVPDATGGTLNDRKSATRRKASGGREPPVCVAFPHAQPKQGADPGARGLARFALFAFPGVQREQGADAPRSSDSHLSRFHADAIGHRQT